MLSWGWMWLTSFMGQPWFALCLLCSQTPSKSLCHRSSFWRRFITYTIFWLTKFSKHFWYPIIILHMKQTNVLDFDVKSDRNSCFFLLKTLGLFQRGWCTTFSAQGDWVIRLGQRSPTGQWRQRFIDAECFVPRETSCLWHSRGSQYQHQFFASITKISFEGHLQHLQKIQPGLKL